MNRDKPVAVTPPTAAELMAKMDRKEKREAELLPLMAKYNDAKIAGFDLTDRDKSRLLALLLDDILDGVGNYRI